MPFASTTKGLILKHKAYQVRSDQYTSSSLSQLIDEQLADISTNLPDLIATIESDLQTLETLDGRLTTEGGSTDAMLQRADVVVWDTSRGKTSGISNRYETIRQRVARLLSNAVDDSGCGGQGMLMRG